MENKSLPLILLCAGASTRMGFPKGLLTWEGKPLLVHQIERFLQMQSIEMKKHVVLVLGHHQARYRECLSQTDLSRVQIVVNSQPDRGQFSSLQEGIKALGLTAWSFLLPIDCPSPGPEVWTALWQAKNASISALIPRRAKRPGHPLLLGKRFLHSLRDGNADARLDSLIKNLSDEEKKYVDVLDASIHVNINTPDYLYPS